MIEIERQVSETPAICVICQYSEYTGKVHIAHFENEKGEVIAYPGQEEFRSIMAANFEEVAAAVQDCYGEAEKRTIRLRL